MTETTHTPDALPQAEATAKAKLSSLQADLGESVLAQALPVPDLAFGGAMLLLVIMFHAVWMRSISSTVLKRFIVIQSRPALWRADVVFAMTVLALLAVHLAEVFLWSSALVAGNIVYGWARAAYFAANCYTALGEPFSLPPAWRMLPPIIAISGIFTFAWTASVLVDFVSRYNTLRADILARRHKPPDARKNSP
ncbi:MAG: hypothetical protein IPJ48_17185 [Propionivibrio sp.]|uniref:Uncharacterized protein n=1 Tax=Candidatus Propionivibrio dominans TaxID=2954373 RepID=A0A9D7FE29_9RHOO|nr:hypothetical protein [Candidatus Propionivibrio dominans]MBL0166436.1 hypothetical protein [Propionivibrio sp.]